MSWQSLGSGQKQAWRKFTLKIFLKGLGTWLCRQSLAE